MNIDYKITKYFLDNNLFNNNESNGLLLKIEANNLIIEGNSRDLVELADILVSISKNKDNTHIHLDELSLISNNSDIKEIIIEKNN